MSSISNILSQFPDFQHLTSNRPFALQTQQFQARAQTYTTSNFSFTTAEGDRVSLSTGSESKISFESYNFQGLAEGQAVDFRSQQLSTFTRSDFNLLIEGDLNEQELADIQAFLQLAKDILQEVAAGNVENATEGTLSLGDLDSLSSAAVFFRQETTVSLEARSTLLAVQENGGSPEPRRRGFDAAQGHKLEHIFEKIRKVQEQFQIEPDKLAKRFPRLLTKLVETLGKSSYKEDSPQSLFEQVRKELFPSLLQATQNLGTEEETSEEEAEETDNPELVQSIPPSTIQNGEILANLLSESKET
jgi:hypothetical protein